MLTFEPHSTLYVHITIGAHVVFGVIDNWQLALLQLGMSVIRQPPKLVGVNEMTIILLACIAVLFHPTEDSIPAKNDILIGTTHINSNWKARFCVDCGSKISARRNRNSLKKP